MGTPFSATQIGSSLPLEGLVVIDFSWALAGPWLTKILAEHGATVIRIESSRRLDVNRRSGPYRDGIPGVNRTAHWACLNNDKLDITLNLKHPRAAGIVRKLVVRADVVVENFTPGSVGKLGLGYQSLTAVNPGIIMVSLSAQGQTGPHSKSSGYGWLLQALSGLQFVSGFPDRPPVNAPGSQVTDYCGSYFGMVAIMAALDHRARTGLGQYIDLSEMEGAVSLLGVFLLDYVVNGREVLPMANRHPSATPHGIFRCRGSDRWCAVSVGNDDGWQNLIAAMPAPQWAADPRLSTAKGRKDNEDELERLLEVFTTNFTAEQLMAMLQALGIAAGAVEDIEDAFADPQLRWRRHFQALEHGEIGWHQYAAPGFKLCSTPHALRRAAPILGQDNEYVYRELLGLSPADYAEMSAAGVFD
ncbi:MAG: CoA transferase [Chloroflexota bacterium]